MDGPPLVRPWLPSSCAEVRKLGMTELRDLCRSIGAQFSGRVTKSDLFYLACETLRISTSGEAVDESGASSEKPSLPAAVRDAYGKLPSFSSITSGWSVEALCRMPHFTMSSVTDYLIDSPDKNFDGKSLRAYKQLRAYQLFDERHLHDVELNLWSKGTHFFFVRAKCWPSQDTSKAAYKCVVCIDREVGRCYGARCRCVSGLGEACSHVAALLFALEDFCSRGMRDLRGPTVTEVICRWSKPAAQKIDPRPLEQLMFQKAGSGSRKRKAWVRDGISKYDPRHPDDRQIDVDAVAELCLGLRGSIGDCGFLRLCYDLHDPPSVPVVGDSDLPDTLSDIDPRLAPNVELEVIAKHRIREGSLVEQRQAKLYEAVGLIIVDDGARVDEACLRGAFEKLHAAEQLSVEQCSALEKDTLLQSCSELWHAEHVGRITSSVVHRVVKMRRTTAPDKLVSSLLGLDGGHCPKSLNASDPRQHGHEMEGKARQAYLELQAERGQPVQVEEHGLFVSSKHPYLAASTDGIVTTASGDRGVLEIKCPVADVPVDVLPSVRKTFCLEQSGDSLRLKRNHQYHSQLQMEMAITGCAWADFVVFVQHGEEDASIHVERIEFDSAMWSQCLGLLEKFYIEYVVLELLTRRLKRNLRLQP